MLFFDSDKSNLVWGRRRVRCWNGNGRRTDQVNGALGRNRRVGDTQFTQNTKFRSRKSGPRPSGLRTENRDATEGILLHIDLDECFRVDSPGPLGRWVRTTAESLVVDERSRPPSSGRPIRLHRQQESFQQCQWRERRVLRVFLDHSKIGIGMERRRCEILKSAIAVTPAWSPAHGSEWDQRRSQRDVRERGIHPPRRVCRLKNGKFDKNLFGKIIWKNVWKNITLGSFIKSSSLIMNGCRYYYCYCQ